MATQCFKPLRGKRVRVTELDVCGNPVTGNSFVVSDGFVTVALTSELEEGDEYIQKNADGRLCINERAPDSLKRLTVTIDWCEVDPELIQLITGYPPEMDGADAVGFRIQSGESDTNWGLEVWTGLAGAACEDGDVTYGYLLIPYITGSTLGDYSIGNEVANFQTTGYTVDGSGWGVGPYDVIGGTPGTPLDVAIGATDHALLRTTTTPPPAAQCGAQVIS